MTALSAHAKQTIREHGLTVSQYIRNTYGLGAIWHGDVCGCTDDRCANGYHHDGVDDCRCLPVILGEMLGGRR